MANDEYDNGENKISKIQRKDKNVESKQNYVTKNGKKKKIKGLEENNSCFYSPHTHTHPQADMQ